jgi:hypothetical protein
MGYTYNSGQQLRKCVMCDAYNATYNYTGVLCMCPIGCYNIAKSLISHAIHTHAVCQVVPTLLM